MPSRRSLVRGPGSNQHRTKPPQPADPTAAGAATSSAAAGAAHADPLATAPPRSFDGRLAREKPAAHPAARWSAADDIPAGDLVAHPDGQWRRVRRVDAASGGHVVIDTGRRTPAGERRPLIVHRSEPLQHRPAAADDPADPTAVLADVVDGAPIPAGSGGGHGYLEVLASPEQIAHAHRGLEQAHGRSGDTPPAQPAAVLAAEDRTGYAAVVDRLGEPVAYARLDADETSDGAAWWQATELVAGRPQAHVGGQPADRVDARHRLNEQLDREQRAALTRQRLAS